MEPTKPIVQIYTDGSCLGNPGPGGYAAVLIFNDKEKEIVGGEKQTTNNRMELTALIKALEALKKPCAVNICTDSKYVMDGITSWLPKWKRNGFKTAAKKDVLNKDLWERLDKALAKHTYKFNWVKGHSGHTFNERVDALAQNAARTL